MQDREKERIKVVPKKTGKNFPQEMKIYWLTHFKNPDKNKNKKYTL